MQEMSRSETRKFIIDVKEVWCHTVEVELPANATRQQIVEAVQGKLADGEEGTTEYDNTLAPEQWNVRDDEGRYL